MRSPTEIAIKLLGILLLTLGATKADSTRTAPPGINKTHKQGIIDRFEPQAGQQNAQNTKTAADLINAAHKHDNMYTLGPQASQQKALELYQAALQAQPDAKQRLHILYRTAQLYGSAYQLEKGEKPHFHKAISLYKEIVESYPADEPLVFKAIISIGDHYIVLRQFLTALQWHKRALEYDTSSMDQQLEALGQSQSARALKQTVEKIKFYQNIAVDQVAYSAEFMPPQLAYAQLSEIANAHAGTFIADRARLHLEKVTAKMSELSALPEPWPTEEQSTTPDTANLQTEAVLPEKFTDNKIAATTKPQILPQVQEKHYRTEQNTTQSLQKDNHLPKQSRDSPSEDSVGIIIVASGLLVICLAAVKFRRSKVNIA